MRYLSVCSGIEAASVAWEPLGFVPAAFAEIDTFAKCVLAHRWPAVKNLGDFTKIGTAHVGSIDILVGGTPCQDFSVAGLRAGLAGDRGRLTIEFLRLAERTRPRWLVWENVPGVLSADGGCAFGTFLRLLGELGYGFAYRVLDAQHFGVPQRRRRVFVVGYLGDWRRAASVLFERESLSGNPPPRRDEGQVAPTIPSRSTAGGGLGTDFDCDGGLLLGFRTGARGEYRETDAGGTLRSSSGDVASGGSETLVAGTLRASASGVSRVGNGEVEMLVTHSLRAEGFDASEDGTGRGIPLVVPVAFSCKDHAADAGDLAPTLRAMDGKRTGERGAANGGGQVAVMTAVRNGGRDSDHRPGRTGTTTSDETMFALQAEQQHAVADASTVRRLTPVECERLQGFPDDYTLVPFRKKPAADGPRYRSLGNSMAVPVMGWIGERIARVEASVV